MELPHFVQFRGEPRIKLHRKAKTTPVSRFLLVSRVEDEHWTYAETAEACGVTERRVGKWVQRFRHGRVAALDDGSSRPGPPAPQTPPLAVYPHGLAPRAARSAPRGPRAGVADARDFTLPILRSEWTHS
jgi:hypothetical protein